MPIFLLNSATRALGGQMICAASGLNMEAGLVVADAVDAACSGILLAGGIEGMAERRAVLAAMWTLR